MKIEEMNEAALASDEVVLSSQDFAENQTEEIDEKAGQAEEEDSSDEVSFADLGLDQDTLKAVEKKGFKVPSPIQVLAIPRLLNGDTNLIARARTGTGKTAAFGLPIIQSIKEKSDKVQALILEPTRELAIQTCEEMQSFASKSFPRTTVLYGGASYVSQIRELKKGCEIVVGTPGRIKDHLERKTLDLSKIKYFILDEGDGNALVCGAVKNSAAIAHLLKVGLGIKLAQLCNLVTGLDIAGIDEIRDLAAALCGEVTELQNACALKKLNKLSLISFHVQSLLLLKINRRTLRHSVCMLQRGRQRR